MQGTQDHVQGQSFLWIGYCSRNCHHSSDHHTTCFASTLITHEPYSPHPMCLPITLTSPFASTSDWENLSWQFVWFRQMTVDKASRWTLTRIEQGECVWHWWAMGINGASKPTTVGAWNLYALFPISCCFVLLFRHLHLSHICLPIQATSMHTILSTGYHSTIGICCIAFWIWRRWSSCLNALMCWFQRLLLNNRPGEATSGFPLSEQAYIQEVEGHGWAYTESVRFR